jgi:hypothetical protein
LPVPAPSVRATSAFKLPVRMSFRAFTFRQPVPSPLGAVVPLVPPQAVDQYLSLPSPPRQQRGGRSCGKRRVSRGRLVTTPQLLLPAVPQSSITAQALLKVISGGIRIRSQPAYSPQVAMARVQSAFHFLWADTTVSRRHHLVHRWVAYCHQHQLPLDDASVVLFVMAQPALSPGSQFQYLKDLSGTFKRLQLPRLEIQAMQNCLAADGAAMPEDQAKPMQLDDLERWLPVLEPMVRLAAMLAWKTASRWGEVAKLAKVNFIVSTEQEVIIDWADLPKGCRRDKYKPSMYTVICGRWTREIHHLLRLAPMGDEPFCPWQTADLDREIKKWPWMEEYSGHSFKKGAATFLVEAMVQRQLPIQPHELSVLLKHKLVFDLLSSSDLRYPSMGPNLARLLGTQKVTKWL